MSAFCQAQLSLKVELYLWFKHSTFTNTEVLFICSILFKLSGTNYCKPKPSGQTIHNALSTEIALKLYFHYENDI